MDTRNQSSGHDLTISMMMMERNGLKEVKINSSVNLRAIKNIFLNNNKIYYTTCTKASS